MKRRGRDREGEEEGGRGERGREGEGEGEGEGEREQEREREREGEGLTRSLFHSGDGSFCVGVGVCNNCLNQIRVSRPGTQTLP